jgi:hypothetical protein
VISGIDWKSDGRRMLRAAMGGFRRSGTFGIVGVIVVAVVVAVIATTMGSGQARPKLALGLIFGVIALFMLILFVLQARDVDRAEAASVPEAVPASALGDPTTLAEAELWAALAVDPITPEAVQARQAVWGTVRSSMRLGWVITPLIFLSVVPIYLFDTFVPILIGAPLIGLIALWKSVGLLRTGGVLDESYDRVGVAMRPLGLDIVERPTVWFMPRVDRPLFSPEFAGAVVLEGRRHERGVSVCFPAGGQGVRSPSAVTLGSAVPDFEATFRDGRLRAKKGGPPEVGRSLGAMPASKRWSGVKVEGGPEGLIVYRRSSREGDWLCDLWLAERLAGALGA